MANTYLDNLQVMRAQIIAEHEETLKSIDSLITRFSATVATSNVSNNATKDQAKISNTSGKRGRPKGASATATSSEVIVEPKTAKAPKGKKANSFKKIRLNMPDVAAFTAQALTAEPKTKNEIAAMYANLHGLPSDFTAQVERGVYIILMEMEKNKTVNTQKLASDARIKLYSKK
jgi:hypothetical protein